MSDRPRAAKMGLSWTLAAGLALGVPLVGCASSDDASAARGSKALRPADFVTAGGPARADAAPAPAGVLDVNQSVRRGPVEVTGPVGEQGGLEVAPRVSTPTASADAKPAGPPVLVDAKIGEVNGKPIYASTFFDVGGPNQEPIGPRLMAAAKDRAPAVWREYAAQEIVRRLDEVIRDELLRAEAYANLPQEKRQGLLAYIEDMQSEARRKAGGSREAYRRELETAGLTPEQMLKLRETGALIYLELQQKVDKRVNVTSRDISQAYNGRFFDRYHHPRQYAFRLVMMPSSAAADRAAVEQAIAAHAPFEQIAAMKANRYKRDDDPAKAGLELREVKDPTAPGALFAAKALNDAAVELALATDPADRVRGPIAIEPNVAWLYLERETDPPDLYNAQLEIEDQLSKERREDLQRRYLMRLQGRATVTSIPEMRQRLMDVAIERYMPVAAERP